MMIKGHAAYQPRAHQVLRYVEAHGPCDAETAGTGIGLNAKVIWRSLSALVDAGFLAHETGAEGRRVYMAIRPADELPQPDPAIEQARLAGIQANRVHIKIGSHSRVSPMSRSRQAHDALRARLAADVERFLQQGNSIEQLPGPRDPADSTSRGTT